MDLKFRFASIHDLVKYFEWVNDENVLANSFNSEQISFDDHQKWFKEKLVDKNTFLYLFLTEENLSVGQVRIEKCNHETIIGITIDKAFRGRLLAHQMLLLSTENYLDKFPNDTILAYIKSGNTVSKSVFLKAGFSNEQKTSFKGSECITLSKNNENRK